MVTKAGAISAQLKNVICIQPKLRIKALLVLGVLCSSPTKLHWNVIVQLYRSTVVPAY